MSQNCANRETALRGHQFLWKRASGRGLMIVCGVLLLSSSARAQGEPVFPAPQLESVWNFLSGKPVRDRVKFRKTDKLLRPPFSGAPEESPKGLAAKIRAEEVDVPKRVEAVTYLGTIDCVAYPEAQEMLIDVLHNDKWEPVRLAAAQALEVMLSRCNGQNGPPPPVHCGDPRCKECREALKAHKEAQKEAEKRAKKARRTPRPRIEQEARYDTCPGCCNKEVLQALAKTAYEYNEDGCCFEPSQRVREAAVRAIAACGIPCRYGVIPYIEDDVEEDEDDEDDDDTQKGEVDPGQRRGEEDPDREEETPPGSETDDADDDDDAGNEIDVRYPPRAPRLIPRSTSTRPSRETSGQQPLVQRFPELKALNGYCIVGLQSRQFYKAQPQYWSVYENRVYTFSSEAARREFERLPETYAIKFSGFDPVSAGRDGQYVEGKYLRIHDERFFLFATRENWEEFKRNPDAYYAPDAVNLASGRR